MRYTLLISINLFISQLLPAKPLKVAVLMPIQHQAMHEIAAGISQSLASDHSLQFEIKSYNSQGDSNMLGSLIKQQLLAGTDFIAPIGSNAARMADKQFARFGKTGQHLVAVAVAQDFQFKDAKASLKVFDEIPVQKTLNLLPTLFPSLKKITVIYSADERLIRNLSDLEQYTNNHQITLQKILASNASEIYTASKNIANDSELVIVFKDHLIVSAIDTISAATQKRLIPLIASDEGTVIKGADFAVGVNESGIGVKAGELILACAKEPEKHCSQSYDLANDSVVFVHPQFKTRFPEIFGKLSKSSAKLVAVSGK